MTAHFADLSELQALLPGIQIRETEGATPGSGVYFPDQHVIAMHPLDLIAIQTPSALDRLQVAIAWILNRALRRLSAAEPTSGVQS